MSCCAHAKVGAEADAGGGEPAGLIELRIGWHPQSLAPPSTSEPEHRRVAPNPGADFGQSIEHPHPPELWASPLRRAVYPPIAPNRDDRPQVRAERRAC